MLKTRSNVAVEFCGCLVDEPMDPAEFRLHKCRRVRLVVIHDDLLEAGKYYESDKFVRIERVKR